MTEPWKANEPDEEHEYNLVLPFIDQSPEFTLGFECGQQYARMKYGREATFDQMVHTENQGQLVATARAAKWRVRFEPADDHWSIMYAERL